MLLQKGKKGSEQHIIVSPLFIHISVTTSQREIQIRNNLTPYILIPTSIIMCTAMFGRDNFII